MHIARIHAKDSQRNIPISYLVITRKPSTYMLQSKEPATAIWSIIVEGAERGTLGTKTHLGSIEFDPRPRDSVGVESCQEKKNYGAEWLHCKVSSCKTLIVRIMRTNESVIEIIRIVYNRNRT